MSVRDKFIQASERFQKQQQGTTVPSDADLERAALQDDSGLIPAPPGWPQIGEEALHGLAGDVVRAIDPHTEADPIAVLAHFLVFFGNCVGLSPHVRVGGDEHSAKLFVSLVGVSSKGRKGTSEGHVRRIFDAVDQDWSKTRIMGGLASGEGLIRALAPKGTSADSRLCVLESEMARVIKAMQRDGSTLSPIIRDAWDKADLAIMRSNEKDCIVARNVHVSIMTHVTRSELVSSMETGQASNGFANRFLWLMVRRTKILPESPPLPDSEMASIVQRTNAAVDHARRVGEMKRDADAARLWRTVYPGLTTGRLGLLGTITSRAEAQVLRLSVVYALLDSSGVILERHLRSALAFWEFANASARQIFGNRLGSTTATRLWTELQDAPSGRLTRAEVYEVFGRNITAAAIDAAVNVLLDMELITVTREHQAVGRPVEAYRLR